MTASIYTDLVPRLPAISPMTLVRLGEPFSDPDWLFEVKHDGFRALCYLEDGTVKLVSRRGDVYKSFRTHSSTVFICPPSWRSFNRLGDQFTVARPRPKRASSNHEM